MSHNECSHPLKETSKVDINQVKVAWCCMNEMHNIFNFMRCYNRERLGTNKVLVLGRYRLIMETTEQIVHIWKVFTSESKTPGKQSCLSQKKNVWAPKAFKLQPETPGGSEGDHLQSLIQTFSIWHNDDPDRWSSEIETLSAGSLNTQTKRRVCLVSDAHKNWFTLQLTLTFIKGENIVLIYWVYTAHIIWFRLFFYSRSSWCRLHSSGCNSLASLSNHTLVRLFLPSIMLNVSSLTCILAKL